MAAPTYVSAENPDIKHKVDTFSSLALKYKFVLGLGKRSRILLLGPYYQAISQDLRQYFADVHSAVSPGDASRVAAGNSYDLVCLDAYSDWTDDRVDELITTARSYLADNGTLVVAATNRLSIERFLAYLRRRVVNLMQGQTPGGYRKALAAVGLSRVTEFMVFPSLRTADEYVTTAHGDIELPAYVSFLHKIFHRLGFFRYVHGDFLYIATVESGGGLDAFMKLVDGQIAAGGHAHEPLQLERFDMRDRGALMFMLSDSAKNRRVVARVAVSGGVNSVIARNTSFTDSIHSLPRLDARIMGLVPKTIAAFEYRDGFVYVENRIRGVLVWKVSGDSRIERRAYTESFDFINAFNIATATEKIVDSDLFDEMIGHDLDSIEAAMDEYEGIGVIVRHIGSHLRRHFMHRSVATVWGHGDFGYGNILCDPASGEIHGVIDWDTHVQNELPGVDFCNLVLQKTSVDYNGDVAKTMEALSRAIEHSGALDVTLPEYGNGHFHITTLDYEVCLCLAGLRMIKRSIPYRKEFLLRKAGYAEILRVVDRIMTKTMNKNTPAPDVSA
jgi:hypothetical protein